MKKYYGEWDSRDDLVVYYGTDVPPEEDIVFAEYDCPPYAGSALIVFTKDGKLYENNDSHCSCYGLEDWDPEETSIEALRMRKNWPNLQDALDAWEQR